jgi:hypothetical protein
LEYLDKIVIEPIDDILIFSMFEEFMLKHLALMLETSENQLCVTMKHVFWLLEESFSGSRALLKDVDVDDP